MTLLPFAVFGVMLAVSAASASPVVIRDHDHLALSPKGDRVVDVESEDPGNLAETPHGRVVLRDDKGKILGSFDPCKTCKYASTAWSPKGDGFAFIATDGKMGTATLYAVEKDKPRALTAIKGIANTVRYSADSSHIALLATVGAKKLTGAVEAGAALVGEIGENNDEQRIGVVPAKGGALKLVSPSDTYVYEFDWMPDGKGFVATSAKGNGDNNWWIATLDQIDAASGTMRRIAAPNMQIELPRVSPDGKTVAFIGGLMSDWQSIGGDVYTVPIEGGEPRDIRPDFAGSFRSIDWRGNRLMTGALIGGLYSIALYDPTTGQLQPQGFFFSPMSVRSSGVSSAVASSADGNTVAMIAEDFNHAFEIMLGHREHVVPITHDNARLAQNVSASNVGWKNEQFLLQGWLVGPKEPASGKHPMVVIVHGGPSSTYTPHYIAAGGQHGDSFDFAYDLIQKGYYIFYPNDRGSYGQGEAFTRANIKDFGRGDFRDMLAGVDAVEKIAPIDDSRLGLYGHSYGGWFSMWADTQTNRFKAFVAGAGIANWTSYYGQNGIDQWMVPFFGASVYDDPKVYRDASPIEFIKGAKTPMLLYVGERDVECPAPQSLEYWHALKTIGTPTELHIYAGEGHHFRKLKDLEDLRARILGWYDKFLR
jgi:dipeptidyl aminopeptidase/acylaminoacyl peptidase